MSKRSAALLPNEPDPAILAEMIWVEHICLLVLVVVVAINIAGWVIPAFAEVFPSSLLPMKTESVLAVMLGVLSLILSEPTQPKLVRQLSIALALGVGVVAFFVLVRSRLDLLAGVETPLPATLRELISGKMSQKSALGFGLLSCTMILTTVRSRLAVRIADVLTFALCLTVLTLVSGHIFGALHFYGNQTVVPTSPQTLFCIMLLTIVVVLRRAEYGVFSIFIGRGIGGRLARILSPIILILPFVREGARARIIGDQLPTNYLTATLASMAAIISLGLMLYLAWRINGMESEIHALTLRDELTGLYNLRGFQLLAEQAMRLAHRSGGPFSVMFIDVDNLKHTNDNLGHSAGSTCLVETSVILQATFRESDVLGRIGGDEFAVAGHFSSEAIAIATERLESSCMEMNAEAGRQYELSFSVGHVTTTVSEMETLAQLLARADREMYKMKRSKKDMKPAGRTEGPRGKHGPQLV